MEERLKHREAFEFYYSLGEKRHLRHVASRYGVGRWMAERWSSGFGWADRVLDRDKRIADRLAEKNENAITKTKRIYREDIKVQIKVLKDILATAITKLENHNLDVHSVNDVNQINSAFEKLVKLDLNLLGEGIDSQSVNLNITGGLSLEHLSDDELRSRIEGLRTKRVGGAIPTRKRRRFKTST